MAYMLTRTGGRWSVYSICKKTGEKVPIAKAGTFDEAAKIIYDRMKEEKRTVH